MIACARDIARVRDAAALAALHRVCFDRPWSENSFADLLKGAGVHALGDADGFIVIRCVAGEAEILTLGVVPARRRAGLARELVRAALRLAVDEHQVGHVFLEVAADNNGARDLYAGLGFICHGRRRQYYAKMDALMMLCDLTQGGNSAIGDGKPGGEKKGGAQP